jgi:hypothetical protein
LVIAMTEEEKQRAIAESRAAIRRADDVLAGRPQISADSASTPNLTDDERKTPPTGKLPRVDSMNERHRREITEQDERFARERRAREREERRQAQSSITAADVAAMIAAERVVVLEELAEHLAERFEKQRDRCDELLSQIRTLTVAFESLNASFSRLEGASSGKVIDLPPLPARPH